MVTLRRPSAVLLLALLLFSATPPVAHADIAGDVAALVAIQTAIKGIQEAISQADQATANRLAQTKALLDQELTKLDELIKNYEKYTEDVLAKAFADANDLLYNTTQSTLAIEASFNQGIQQSIVSAASALQKIPLVTPFAALTYPLVFPANKIDPAVVHVIGFFKTSWPMPTATVNGVALGVQLETGGVRITVPPEVIKAAAGHVLMINLCFPYDCPWFFGKMQFTTRAIPVRILPEYTVRYTIIQSTQKAQSYDHLEVIRDRNTTAGKGTSATNSWVFPFDELAGALDPKYDANQSFISAVSIVASDGNNPAGQNGSSAWFDRRAAYLNQGAVGSSDSCGHGWAHLECWWGEGANRHDRIAVDLSLYDTMAPPVTCGLNVPTEDYLRPGKDVLITAAQPLTCPEFETFTMGLLDYSFDPPQERHLSINDYYSSDVVRVAISRTGAVVTARSYIPLP